MKQEKDMDDIFGEQGESKTAFNSALDIIQRISRLEYSLTSCFIDKPEDIRGAYKLLVLIHSEIDFKLSEEERKDLMDTEESIYKYLNAAEWKYTHEGFMQYKYPELREEIILALLELKKTISKLKYKVGLGMIDQSDPRYALLNG